MTAATYIRRGTQRSAYRLRTLLLAGSLSLFLGVLLSDIAYVNRDQVQWKNFAWWLNAGAHLFFSGLALLWSVVLLIETDRVGRSSVLSSAMLLAGGVLGFVNSIVHAKEAGATRPESRVRRAPTASSSMSASVSTATSLSAACRPSPNAVQIGRTVLADAFDEAVRRDGGH